MSGHLSETKIYIASTKCLEDEQIFEKWYQAVSKSRQDKIDRLRFPKDKRQSLAAELLLKKALALNGIYEYHIEADQYGKPYLIGEDSVKFNLSHSEEQVMCVLSDQEVGCDVEKIRDTDYKIAKHFFAKEERDALDYAAGDEKKDLFFRIWTLKESFMKATGLGMGLSLKDFYFKFDEKQVDVYQSLNEEQYYFKEVDFFDGYKYAVCSRNPLIHDSIVRVQL